MQSHRTIEINPSRVGININRRTTSTTHTLTLRQAITWGSEPAQKLVPAREVVIPPFPEVIGNSAVCPCVAVRVCVCVCARACAFVRLRMRLAGGSEQDPETLGGREDVPHVAEPGELVVGEGLLLGEAVPDPGHQHLFPIDRGEEIVGHDVLHVCGRCVCVCVLWTGGEREGEEGATRDTRVCGEGGVGVNERARVQECA